MKEDIDDKKKYSTSMYDEYIRRKYKELKYWDSLRVKAMERRTVEDTFEHTWQTNVEYPTIQEIYKNE